MDSNSYLKDYIRAVEQILNGHYVLGLDCMKIINEILIEAKKGKKISKGLELLFVASDIENKVLMGEDPAELYKRRLVEGGDYPNIRDRCRGLLNDFVQKMKGKI